MTSCSTKQDGPTGNITPLNINSEEHIKYVMDLPVDELIPCAQTGDRVCQFELALVYFNGEELEENNKEAHKWLKLSADQGYPDAQNEIGYLYENGCKCHEEYTYPQDYTKALEWFMLAADQGDQLAQYNIGRFYSSGLGVKQNPELAYEWFKTSAENGYNCAQYGMGQMLYVGIGTDKNTSKALQWLLISEEISERVYKDRYSNNIDIQSMHPLQENQLYKDIVALSKTVASELSEDDINMARENALKWLKKNP